MSSAADIFTENLVPKLTAGRRDNCARALRAVRGELVAPEYWEGEPDPELADAIEAALRAEHISPAAIQRNMRAAGVSGVGQVGVTFWREQNL